MDIHAVFSMVKDLFKKLFLHSPKRTFFVVGGLIVMLALPVTILLTSQSQDLRQRASENPQGIPGNVLTLLKGYAYPAYLPDQRQGIGCSVSGCTELYTCKDGELASTFGYGRDEAGSGSVSWYTINCPQGSVCRNVNIGGDAGIQCVKQNPTVTCNDIYEDANYSCTTQDRCGSPNTWYEGGGTICKNIATNYGCCKTGFNCYNINCTAGQTCIEEYPGAGRGYCPASWSLDNGAACGGPQGPSGSACKLGSSCGSNNICVPNSSVTQAPPGVTTSPPTPSPTPALPSVGTVAVDTCVGNNPSSARFRWTRTQTGLNYEVRWGSDTSYSEKQTYGEVSESSVISGFTPGTIYYSIRPYLGSVAGPSSTGTKTIPSTCGDVTLPTDTPNPGSSGGTGTNVCPGTCQANNKLGTACTGGSWSPMGGSCITSDTSCQTCITSSSGTKQEGEPCTKSGTTDNCAVGYICQNYWGSGDVCISRCGIKGCTEPRYCTNVTADMKLGVVGWMCYAPPTPSPTPRPTSPLVATPTTSTTNTGGSTSCSSTGMKSLTYDRSGCFRSTEAKAATVVCNDGTQKTFTSTFQCTDNYQFQLSAQNFCSTHKTCPTPTVAASPTPTTSQGLSCDPNQDGKIDTLDFQIWRDEYNSKNGVRSACFAPSNTTVDLLDFQAWKDINFGRIPVL